MESSNLISIISVIAVFVSLLLAFFLLTVPTKNKLGNFLLAAFIILNAIDLSGWFIYHITKNHPDLEVFRWSVSWLINPVFFLYALSVCFSDFHLKIKHLLHAIPFLLYNLFLLPKVYLADLTAKTHFITYYGDSEARKIFSVLGHLQFIFYVIAILLVLKKYRKIYLENYADNTTITYKWLFQLTVVIIIVHSIVTLKDLLMYISSRDIFNGAQIIVGVNAVFILCWFVLKALYSPDLFRGIDSKTEPAESLTPISPNKKQQPKEAVIPENNKDILKIRNYMTLQEPYLEPSLTIQDLADQLEMPVRDLSILINNQLDQHFF